ncbi:Uncharacterized membrane protein YcaP, DUF421 family [Marininema mesophilum]|uniref:Uncharacterized membrane protein YcaP, DUF421 family n=1 Tax=Marininema mesophilum TaxID=1048340 RepID=A0A1H2VP86_9BACL|nr:DUF421 domain-containing protein [Marininema mesophilum]SDW70135.1 Uncharacterized membrane protein YcaP, DUF421 family [Marininema mesophilum]
MMYFEVFYQTVLAFGTILVLTIFLGKQQIAEMTFFEYVNGITFGSIAADMATDLDDHTTVHFFGLVLFVILTFLLSYISLKSRRASRWLLGDPVIVVSNGKILENNIRKNRFTISEIMQLLREKDVFDVSNVQLAVLESSGVISVLLKPEYQPVTEKDMGIKPPKKPLQTPMELVVDGQIIYENLRHLGKDGKWLMKELHKKASVGSLRNVFYAAMETNGELYVDKRRD